MNPYPLAGKLFHKKERFEHRFFGTCRTHGPGRESVRKATKRGSLGGVEAKDQRTRTKEQMAREFTRLKEIEAERAKRRQGTRTDLNIVENLPPGEPEGKARDIAAVRISEESETGSSFRYQNATQTKPLR